MAKRKYISPRQRKVSKVWLNHAIDQAMKMQEEERVEALTELVDIAEDGNTIVGKAREKRTRGRAITLADICAGAKPPSDFWMSLDEFGDLSGLGYFKACSLSKTGALPGRMQWEGRTLYRRDALTLLIQRIKDAGSWERAVLGPILSDPNDLVEGAIIRAREKALVDGKYVDPRQATPVDKKVEKKKPGPKPKNPLTPEEMQKQADELDAKAFLMEVAKMNGFEGETVYEVKPRGNEGGA